MKNDVQNGNYIDVAAPSGGVVSGEVVIIGALVGIAVTDADEADPVSIATTGVFDLPKDGSSGPVFEVGDYVYYDGSECTDDDGDDLIGVCVKDAGANVATVRVRLMVGATGPTGATGETGATGPSGG
jgi:predicted RecA/RadA family phage recombinase